MPVLAQSQEFRAYWVDAFHDGCKSAAQIDSLLATVHASNMNAVVVQMRKRGNTYYPSSLDPWAPDADRSFDALAYLIRKAHSSTPRIEVHCWFCMMPIWKSLTPPTDANHIFNLHPEWLTQTSSGELWNGENYCIDPGVPAAVQYMYDVIMDAVNRYDIDGVHYDYVRYAGKEWGYNPTAVSRFNAQYGRVGQPAANDADWLQFRRDQITALVRKLYTGIAAAKPACKVSAATITWGNGPSSDSAWLESSAYSNVLQDWRAWMEEGILDINMPMTYYSESSNSSSYDNWIAFEKAHKYNRHLVIGLGSYLNSLDNSYSQLYETRTLCNGCSADGQILYCYGVPYSGGDGQALSIAGSLTNPQCRPNPMYPSAVQVPDMPWKSTPTKGHLRGRITEYGKAVDGAQISISGPQSRTTRADGTGWYSFVDLVPGTYTVSFSAPGCKIKESSITVAVGKVASLDADLSGYPVSAPVVSNVTAEDITCTSAIITWTTDRACTSQAQYGISMTYDTITQENNAYITFHRVRITDLSPNQTYHFRVKSIDRATWSTYSTDFTFTTAAAPLEGQ